MVDHPDDTGMPTLLDGLLSTRAIRRFTDQDVTEADLNEILFAATRGPSGHNMQPFRFVVSRRKPESAELRAVIARGFQEAWTPHRQAPDADDQSRRARMARTMSHFVDHVGEAPVIVIACLDQTVAGRGLGAGASVYPACQNLLLAARALGYGGVMTHWHRTVESELRALLELPEEVVIAATIPIGRPVGTHGPVRRRPLPELIYEDRWGVSATWAADPPGTRYTSG